MAYTIGNGCINCGVCQKKCIFGAIRLSRGGKVEIMHDRCVDCGLCKIYCPVGAPERIIEGG